MRKRKELPLVGLIVIVFTLHVGVNAAQAGDADIIVNILNTQYGTVCKAQLTGWFTKTIRIDWTENTNKIHAIKILAEVSTVKEKLYEDGVRYLQFPNDAGTYNIIDWKTGERKSINERAPYFFN